MNRSTSRMSDDELLALVSTDTEAAPLTRADVVAAGRVAWTWRAVSAEIAQCLMAPDRPPLDASGEVSVCSGPGSAGSAGR
jgi:hypothetical protein